MFEKQSLKDVRFTLGAVAKPVVGDAISALREVYLQRHPEAFYVDFGDFRWFKLEDIAFGRFNGGFARAAKVDQPNAILSSLNVCVSSKLQNRANRRQLCQVMNTAESIPSPAGNRGRILGCSPRSDFKIFGFCVQPHEQRSRAGRACNDSSIHWIDSTISAAAEHRSPGHEHRRREAEAKLQASVAFHKVAGL